MANPDTQVVSSVCDRAQARFEKVTAIYLNVKTTDCLEHPIGDPWVDAIVIATPVAARFELAMAALIAGKHVFVEKPITTTSV